MAPIVTTPNYSLFAIPAYLLIAMTPHMYSSIILTPAQKHKSAKVKNMYNMPNPRSSTNNPRYSASLDNATFARWERARAAHDNMLENSAFFVSAILAGIVTRCDAEYMNRMAGVYLVSRMLYVVTYVGISRGVWSVLRTMWYMLGNFVLMGLWWEAGKKVMSGQF